MHVAHVEVNQMINIWKCSVSPFLAWCKSHFFLPNLCSCPMVEDRCSGDLGAASASDADAHAGEDDEVELWRSSGASLVGELTDQLALAWATFPADPSRLAFPRPSRWAWNAVICCSRDRKLSCTLSNCQERSVLVFFFFQFSPPSLSGAFDRALTCSMLAWSSSSGHTDSALLQLPLAWLLMWVWLHVSSCG